MRWWLIVGCVAAPAAVAQAGLVEVEFSITPPSPGTPLVTGAFSFDTDKLTGPLVGYGDLEDFAISVLGETYCLEFIEPGSGSFTESHFQFNTQTDLFVPTPGGFIDPVVIAAYSGTDGFRITPNPNGRVEEYRNLSNADGEAYADIVVSRVPEPASVALLGAGVVGLAIRRRRTA